MGCCLSCLLEKGIERQKELANKIASKPRQTALGDTMIPMNTVTGIYPNVFPLWLNNILTSNEYEMIISSLNESNKKLPIFDQNQTVKLQVVDQDYKMKKYEKIQQVIESTDNILLQLNKNMLLSKGLQASHTLNVLNENTLTNMPQTRINPADLGVIIKRISNKPLLSEQNNGFKLNSNNNSKVYLQWDHNDVLEWIMSLKNDSYKKQIDYTKYKQTLQITLKEEGINGKTLSLITETDIKDWGIKNIVDKKNLYLEIQNLVSKNQIIDNNNDDNNIDEGNNETKSLIFQ
eukprot:34939_1